jgi:DedD protein
MPFFNFRRGGSNTAPAAGSAAQTDSVEVMRKRAKHRLIGSAVLVLIGVVGFPLVFDTQPRPIPVDIPIEIPGKGTVKPLVVPAPAAATPPTPAPAATPKPPKKWRPTPAGAQGRNSFVKSGSSPGSVCTSRYQKRSKTAARSLKPKPEAKPVAKPEPKPAAKPAATGDDARASALLNGTPPPAAKPAAAEAEGRFVVQVGAFSDVTKAREARLKLEKAGLKTYTQVAETKDGKRIRVRVGPFASKAEAEKAASKIKTLDLPAAILTL